LSIFENEKFWMLSYIAVRRFVPKPILATDASLAAVAPQKSEPNAIATILTPISIMYFLSPFGMPTSIIYDI
jgi:hypothetical protein